MSVLATVVNHNGQTVEMDKPCFGFMSYIHMWNEDEDWDDYDDEDEEREYPIDGFDSNQLKELIYHAHPFQHMNVPVEDRKLAYNGILDAVQKLPQWYGDVKFEPIGDPAKNHFDLDITFPLPNHQMQVTILGGMMLRNIFNYTSSFQSFLYCLKQGIAPHIAFTIAQAFFRSVGFSGSYFYRSADGDESVFGGQSRLCDLAAFIRGELGDTWQGNWGDTVDGYGRYGCYDNSEDSAPQSSRTGYRKDLRDATLITNKDVWDNSPNWTELLEPYRSNYGYTDAVIPFLVEKLEELI